MLYIKDDCLYQENTHLGNIKTVSIFPFDLIEEWSPVQIRPSKETYQYYFSIKVNNVALLNQNVERTDFMTYEMDDLEVMLDLHKQWCDYLWNREENLRQKLIMILKENNLYV